VDKINHRSRTARVLITVVREIFTKIELCLNITGVCEDRGVLLEGLVTMCYVVGGPNDNLTWLSTSFSTSCRS